MISCANIETPRFMVEIILFSIGMILISSIATSADGAGKGWEEETKMPKDPIEEVLKEYTSKLMSIPGVVGTAQGLCSGQPCIKVFVSKMTAELEQRIPKTLKGYPVVIQETGKFKALPDT